MARIRQILVVLLLICILPFNAFADYNAAVAENGNQVSITSSTKYTVKHYKMLLDGTYPSTADDVEELSGKYGFSVTPLTKNYEGFTAPAKQSIQLVVDKTQNNVVYQYTRNKYSIVFNKNSSGVSGTMVNQQLYYGENKPLTANSFIKTGYEFTGWAESPLGSKVYNDAQSVQNLLTTNGTKNLYALWSPITYKVHYNGNGATSGIMTDDTFTYDTTKLLTDNQFTKEGWRFNGWATSPSGDVVYRDMQPVKNLASTSGAVVNLYAKWKLTYTMFDTGTVVNTKITDLVSSSGGTISEIQRADNLKSGFVATDANTVSIENSSYDIYIWYDNGILYWYCADPVVYSNFNAHGMFENNTATSIDLSGVNTSKTTDFSAMFKDCHNVTYLNMTAFDTTGSVNSSAMFENCYRLDTIDLGAKFDLYSDLPYPDSAYITGATGKWYATDGHSYLPEDIPSGIAATYYAKSSMVPPMLKEKATWWRATSKSMSDIKTIVVENRHTTTGLEEESWIADTEDLGSIKCYVTNQVLYIVNEGYPDYDKILLSDDITGMFKGFVNVETITGLQLFNSVNVKTANCVFGDEVGIGTTALKRMEGIDSWNMSNVTSANYMFSGCGLPGLNLVSWRLPNLVDMSSMFENCASTSINLSGWDVEAVTSMESMFANCTNLNTLYLSYWKPDNVADSSNMFADNPELLTIYASAETVFNSTDSANMFANTEKILGGYGTEYDPLVIDKSYAKIDRSTVSGYFTQFIVGDGNIVAKLYENANVSNAFTELTISGATAIPWSYTAGSRLLEIVATNLSTNEENTVDVTVPVGMYIVANSWTTADTNDSLKSATFIKNTNQDTGTYTNAQTGTLRFKVDSATSAIKLTCLVNFDQTIWNKSNGQNDLTVDNVIDVTLDDTKTLSISKVRTSEGYGGSTWGGSINQYQVPKLYIQEDSQIVNTYFRIMTTNQVANASYFKALDIELSLYQLQDGNKVYAVYDTATLPTNITYSNYSITTDSGVTHFHWDDYYATSNAGRLENVKYFIKSEEGFDISKNLKFDINITYTDYTGFQHTFTSQPTSTLGVAELNYNNFASKCAGLTVPAVDWHESENYYGRIASTKFTYNSVVAAPNIGIKIEFDYLQGDGETPKAKVASGYAPLPKGNTVPGTVILIDDDGVQYGPYNITLTSPKDDTGQYLSAKKIAENVGLSGRYWLKTVEYTIANIPGSTNIRYLYSSGGESSQRTGGTWSGLLYEETQHRLTVTFPDGTAKRTQTGKITPATSISESAYISSITASSDNIRAGDSFDLTIEAGSYDYPYGNTNHIKQPELYLLLPYGMEITGAEVRASKEGASIASANVESIKELVIDGITYYDYKLSFDELIHYGGYMDSGTGMSITTTRYYTVHITTNNGMPDTSIELQKHVIFKQKDSSNAIGGGAAKYRGSDQYDLDMDGNNANIVGILGSAKTLSIKARNLMSLNFFDGDKNIGSIIAHTSNEGN